MIALVQPLDVTRTVPVVGLFCNTTAKAGLKPLAVTGVVGLGAVPAAGQLQFQPVPSWLVTQAAWIVPR